MSSRATGCRYLTADWREAGASSDDLAGATSDDPAGRPDSRARGLPDAHRALPARAARALLPDERLGPRGGGPRPGDLPARLEGLGKLPGPLLGAHLALPHRDQRLP